MRNLTHEELELVSGCGPNIAIGNSNSSTPFTTGSGGSGGTGGEGGSTIFGGFGGFGGTGGTGGSVINDNDFVTVGQLSS